MREYELKRMNILWFRTELGSLCLRLIEDTLKYILLIVRFRVLKSGRANYLIHTTGNLMLS